MTRIVFEKWHGLGNDFVIIDKRNQDLSITSKTIKQIADRNRGIGFDQLIVLDKSEEKTCSVAYQFYNPDGSQAEQCGNGQRCIAQYLNNKSPKQNKFCVFGLAGLIYSEILPNKQVKVNMGKVHSFKAMTIEQQHLYHVVFANPHLIILVNNCDTYKLQKNNELYTQQFINGINFEAAEIISQNEIKLRVFERGTGETQACGSGACAAVYALQKTGQLAQKVKVMLPGGNLVVEYHQQTKHLYLTGSATYVFTGEITL